MPDYYSILELEPGAGVSEIKRAYRKLAKEFHPDVNLLPGATEKFVLINEAYEYLIHKLQFEEQSGRRRSTPNAKSEAQTVIDEWLMAERERIRARAQRHAGMKYRNFKKTRIYRESDDTFTNRLAIFSLFLGIFIMVGSVIGTINNYNENPYQMTKSYIGSAIVIFLLGVVITSYSLFRVIMLFRKREGR